MKDVIKVNGFEGPTYCKCTRCDKVMLYSSFDRHLESKSHKEAMNRRFFDKEGPIR